MTGLLSDRFENLQYRGNLLPLGRDKSGELVFATPGLLVDAIKSMELPGRVLRGESVSADDVTKMAMDTMGGSGLLSRAIPTGDVGGLLGINVFHGGPHRWASEPGFPEGRPRMDKIGTGEGAQAYGHGFYSAEAPGVAEQYRKNLAGVRKFSPETSDILSKVDNLGFDTKGQAAAAIRKNTDWAERWDVKSDLTKAEMQKLETELKEPFGTTYKLDIPDADAAKYLDYDAPLSQQPENVRKSALAAVDNLPSIRQEQRELVASGKATGQIILNILEDQLGALDWPVGANAATRSQFRGGAKQAASEALRKAGIPGLKYFDRMSRNDKVQILPRRGSTDGQRVWLVDPGWKDPNKRKTFPTKAEAEAYADDLYRTRNYVTWDQDVLDRTKILERDGKPTGLLGN